MKKWLKIFGIFLAILISLTIFTAPKTEKYTEDDITKVNPMFLVAVNTANHSTNLVTFSEYQRDQNTVKPQFSPFQPTSDTTTLGCPRLKFDCKVFTEPPNVYTVSYRGLFGEGLVNSYRVEGQKIIPLSFTCLEDFCDDS